MSANALIERLISAKKAEILELQKRLAEAEAFVAGLEAAKRASQRAASMSNEPEQLRPGSLMFRAREAMQKAGKPLHVVEMLEIIGESTERKKRAAFAGSVASYARKGKFFKKVGPNTFCLLDEKEETAGM